MLALYVTHPQVVIDPAAPIPSWGLSALGRARVEAASTRPWAAALSRVVSSDEAKAREAAAILARAAGVEPEVWPDLHENDRSATGYLPPEEFERTADAFFARPDESVRGWETARAAQARVVRAVRAALAGHSADRPVALVGHGAVGTLLWLALAGQPISRAADQPPGGGNVFAFPLAGGPPLTRWVPIEAWDGSDARGVSARPYLAFLHGDGDGWGISFPDLPGCVSGGVTRGEAMARGEVALAFHAKGMAADGLPLPMPRSLGEVLADPSLAEWREGAELAWVAPRPAGPAVAEQNGND